MTRRKRGRKKSEQYSEKEKNEYKKSILKKQTAEHLNKSFKPGKSRHEYKIKEGLIFSEKLDTIHSYGTRKNYNNTVNNFIEWASKNVSDFNQKQHFNQLENYVHDYLKDCENRGLSRQTIKTYRSGLGRFYSIADDYKVSTTKDGQRGDVARQHHKHFSVENNADMVLISKATGLRKSELESFKMTDIKQVKGQFIANITKGTKGGLSRTIMIDPKHYNDFKTIYDNKAIKLNFIQEKMNSTDKNSKEFRALQNEYNRTNKMIEKKVHSSMNNHQYRREYANSMLGYIRNNTANLNKVKNLTKQKNRHSDSYEKKIKSDTYNSKKYNISEKRNDLFCVSQLLGHSRIDVIVQSYLMK